MLKRSDMNKKILIGSIIAVAILIGVSFTSVVGYRSVASDVKLSPLFNIRTSRAIDEESEELSCEYVGKGEEILLSIPKRDSYGFLINRALHRLKEIDKDTLVKVLETFMINRDVNIDVLKNIDNNNREFLPNYLKYNPLILENINNSHSKGNLDSANECPSFFLPNCPTIVELIPGFCFIDIIIALIGLPIFIVAIPVVAIMSLLALFGLVIAPFLYFFLTVVRDDCEFSFGALTACVCD